MAPWIEKLLPQSGYRVPYGAILLFTTTTGTVRWRVVDTFNTAASFKGPDNVVPPNSTDVLGVNAYTKSITININVDGGDASYTLLIENDAFNYRVANGLPHGRAPSGDVYGG